MRCRICSRAFKDGDAVLPVLRYVVNEKRGDFVTSVPRGFIHESHLKAES